MPDSNHLGLLSCPELEAIVHFLHEDGASQESPSTILTLKDPKEALSYAKEQTLGGQKTGRQ